MTADSTSRLGQIVQALDLLLGLQAKIPECEKELTPVGNRLIAQLIEAARSVVWPTTPAIDTGSLHATLQSHKNRTFHLVTQAEHDALWRDHNTGGPDSMKIDGKPLRICDPEEINQLLDFLNQGTFAVEAHVDSEFVLAVLELHREGRL